MNEMRPPERIRAAVAILAEEFSLMQKVAGAMSGDIGNHSEESATSAWLIVEALLWTLGKEETAFEAYITELAEIHRRRKFRNGVAGDGIPVSRKGISQ